MKFFIALITITISSFSSAYTCKDVDKLSTAQIDTLRWSYHYGEPHDMGYTLAAIVWKESNAGLWKINIRDPAAGIAQNHLKYSLTRLERKDTSFNRNVLAQQLVDNDNLSLHLAILELKYWYKRHKGNWKFVRSSYNEGNDWLSEKGLNYSEDIRKRLIVLRDCGTLGETNNNERLHFQ